MLHLSALFVHENKSLDPTVQSRSPNSYSKKVLLMKTKKKNHNQ